MTPDFFFNVVNIFVLTVQFVQILICTLREQLSDHKVKKYLMNYLKGIAHETFATSYTDLLIGIFLNILVIFTGHNSYY